MSALAGSIDNIDWPRPDDYDWAIRNRQTAFYDPAIRRGAIQEVAGRPARLNAVGSKYICVYRVGDLVVRCFAAQPPNIYPPPGILRRYRAITSYLQSKQRELPFLVEHTWIDHGVNINGKDLPILKIPYIQHSQPLGEFLMDHSTDSDFRQLASSFANQWLYIIRQLETFKIAHGDLDLTNILVHGTAPNFSLSLIDFDGMYVPTLANSGLAVADNGHDHFQPVNLALRTFGPTMDRFSALIIYLSLSGLSKNPSLWGNCEAEENRSLLGADDFKRLGLSNNLTRLRQETDNAELQLCLDELLASVMQERMPRSLDDILNRPLSSQPERDDPQTEAPELPGYTGRSLPLPLAPGEMRTTSEIPGTPPAPERVIDTTIPDTKASAGTPARSASSSSSTSSRPGRSGQPGQPSKTHSSVWRRIALVLMILVIIGVLIWWYSAAHTQPSTSGFLVLHIQFLLHSPTLPWIPGSTNI